MTRPVFEEHHETRVEMSRILIIFLVWGWAVHLTCCGDMTNVVIVLWNVVNERYSDRLGITLVGLYCGDYIVTHTGRYS